MNEDPSIERVPARYRWPWLVWGFFLLAVVLSVLWMVGEIRRIERAKAEAAETLAPQSAETNRSGPVQRPP